MAITLKTVVTWMNKNILNDYPQNTDNKNLISVKTNILDLFCPEEFKSKSKMKTAIHIT